MIERVGAIMGLAGRGAVSGVIRFFRPHGMITIWEHFKFLALLLIVAVLFRSFVVLPYRVVSGSMMGTLLVGDYYYVSKFSYGFSRFSSPVHWWPEEGRIFGAMPERGEVVVFKLPSDNETDYIKRVIGLPGDRIQVRDGVLYLNSAAIPRVREGTFDIEVRPGDVRHVPQFRETLPNGISYLTLDMTPFGPGDNTQEYVVPEGHFFMMGDNRDNSLDSRFLADVGFVPYENLVGRAEVRFFSTDGSAALWQVWRWPGAIRWGRVFGTP